MIIYILNGAAQKRTNISTQAQEYRLNTVGGAS